MSPPFSPIPLKDRPNTMLLQSAEQAAEQSADEIARDSPSASGISMALPHLRGHVVEAL